VFSVNSPTARRIALDLTMGKKLVSQA